MKDTKSELKSESLINKSNLAVRHCVDTTPSRYSLGVIQIRRKNGLVETVATDGYCAAIVTGPVFVPGSFPAGSRNGQHPSELDPFPPPSELDSPVYLSAENAGKIKIGKSSIPVLKTALVTDTGVITTDLDKSVTFGLEESRDIDFPNVDGIIPSDTPHAKFALELPMLMSIVNTLKEFYDANSKGEIKSRLATAKIEFYDDRSALKLEATNNQQQKLTLVFMPVKL